LTGSRCKTVWLIHNWFTTSLSGPVSHTEALYCIFLIWRSFAIVRSVYKHFKIESAVGRQVSSLQNIKIEYQLVFNVENSLMDDISIQIKVKNRNWFEDPLVVDISIHIENTNSNSFFWPFFLLCNNKTTEIWTTLWTIFVKWQIFHYSTQHHLKTNKDATGKSMWTIWWESWKISTIQYIAHWSRDSKLIQAKISRYQNWWTIEHIE
jgi:hypothetical protein